MGCRDLTTSEPTTGGRATTAARGGVDSSSSRSDRIPDMIVRRDTFRVVSVHANVSSRFESHPGRKGLGDTYIPSTDLLVSPQSDTHIPPTDGWNYTH